MAPLATVVLLSLLSAAAYALAAVGQERLAAGSAGGPSLYLRPRFLLTVALNLTGAGLHLLALRQGSLAIVQPLGALTLVFALPVGAAFAGRGVTGREWRGAAATVVGLTGLLFATDAGAPDEGLATHEIIRVAALTATILAALGAVRAGSERARALRLAAGGGIAFGVASVLAQTQVLRLASGSAAVWVLVGTAVLIAGFALGGMLLAQAAYRWSLGAPLATLTIVNPVAAAVIGFLLLGQGRSVGPGAGVVALAAAAVAARGVVVLANPSRECRLPQRLLRYAGRRSE